MNRARKVPSVKRIAIGRPPDIVHLEIDKSSRAWNAVIRIEGYEVTLAALDKAHAERLCTEINAAAWVGVEVQP